jgi:hypothetical protein
MPKSHGRVGHYVQSVLTSTLARTELLNSPVQLPRVKPPATFTMFGKQFDLHLRVY